MLGTCSSTEPHPLASSYCGGFLIKQWKALRLFAETVLSDFRKTVLSWVKWKLVFFHLSPVLYLPIPGNFLHWILYLCFILQEGKGSEWGLGSCNLEKTYRRATQQPSLSWTLVGQMMPQLSLAPTKNDFSTNKFSFLFQYKWNWPREFLDLHFIDFIQ